MADWIRKQSIFAEHLGFSAVSTGKVWVFRGPSAIWGWSPADAAPAWEHVFSGENLFAMKQVCLVSGAVVTMEVAASGPTNHLVWLDPQSGEVLRRMPCALRPAEGGLRVWRDHVYLYGRDPAQGWLTMRIDGASGEVVACTSAPAGVEMLAFHSGLYIRGFGEDGLFYLDAPDGTWQRALAGEIVCTGTADTRLYFCQAPAAAGERWRIGCWDTERLEGCGGMDIALSQAMILTPAVEPGLVAAHLDSVGLEMLDIDASVERWTWEAAEDRTVNAVACLPGRVAFAVEEDDADTIRIHDARTGAEEAILESGQVGITALHWLDGCLVVSAQSGAECFVQS